MSNGEVVGKYRDTVVTPSSCVLPPFTPLTLLPPCPGPGTKRDRPTRASTLNLHMDTSLTPLDLLPFGLRIKRLVSRTLPFTPKQKKRKKKEKKTNSHHISPEPLSLLKHHDFSLQSPSSSSPSASRSRQLLSSLSARCPSTPYRWQSEASQSCSPQVTTAITAPCTASLNSCHHHKSTVHTRHLSTSLRAPRQKASRSFMLIQCHSSLR